MSPGCARAVPDRPAFAWAIVGCQPPPRLLIWGNSAGLRPTRDVWVTVDGSHPLVPVCGRGTGLASHSPLAHPPEPPPCPLTGTCCSFGQASPGALRQLHRKSSQQGPPAQKPQPHPQTHQPGNRGAKVHIFHTFCFFKLSA